MTIHVVDIASYQQGLSLAVLCTAGFSAINVKISHGLRQKSVNPAVAEYVDQAATVWGMKLSSFHWLDASGSGAEQAEYAYACMRGLGLQVGAAHVVDVEDPSVTADIYRSYLARMVDLLKRPIITYTGDWFAASRPWLQKTDHSPWLWSAPMAGYLGMYPGDNSDHWAGYASWPELDVMQYAVSNVGTIKVSMSAVRSEDTWRAMTGVSVATSQNGWPVIGAGSVTDRALFGVEFPNGWRRGDVDVIFTHLIERLHREVEPLDRGGCWGWFVKNIEGSQSISNHASGTAIDYNAPAHPMGVRNTYSAADQKKIRAILKDLRGVVRWGGDYSGRPDDMHFEIHDDMAAVSAVARSLKEDDMPITPEETKAIAKAAVDELLNRKLKDPYDKSATPRTVEVEDWIRYSPSRGQVEGVGNSVRATGAEIMKLLVAIAARPDVDSNALAGALAPSLASALVPLLPEDKEVSVATLRDAFRGLFTDSDEETATETPQR